MPRNVDWLGGVPRSTQHYNFIQDGRVLSYGQNSGLVKWMLNHGWSVVIQLSSLRKPPSAIDAVAQHCKSWEFHSWNRYTTRPLTGGWQTERCTLVYYLKMFFFYDMVCCSIFTGKNLKNVKKKQCLNTDTNIKINYIKTKHTISFNPFFYFIIFFYWKSDTFTKEIGMPRYVAVWRGMPTGEPRRSAVYLTVVGFTHRAQTLRLTKTKG